MQISLMDAQERYSPMFGFGRNRVTYERGAEELYTCGVSLAKGLGQKGLKSETSPYAGISEGQLAHEWLIVMFWVIHRVPFGCDKERLMSLILKRHFEAAGLMQNKDAAIAERALIIARLEEYDKAFTPSGGSQQIFLGGTIAKNLLAQHEPILDALVAFDAVTAMYLMMTTAKAFGEKHKVIG
jgi:hypothetical protein